MKITEFLKIIKPYRKLISLVMLYAVLLSIIAAVVPFINSNMINYGLLNNNIRITAVYVLATIALELLDKLIQYLQQHTEIQISNDLGKKMKVDAFIHGLKLKPYYFKDKGFFKTVGDALYDIGNILHIINNNFLIIFVIVCKSIGAAIGLVILDYRLAAFIGLMIPLKVLINNMMRKKVEKLGKVQMDANKNYNTWFSDIIAGVTDIKIWNLLSKKTKEYARHIDNINRSSKTLALANSKNLFFMQSLELVFLNTLYILGAVLIVRDQLTFGGLVAFISFSSYLLMPVNAIMDLRLILKEIKPSVDGLNKYFKLEEENYASALPSVSDIRSIEFKEISMVFDERTILHDISFTIKKGEKTALVGDNGSGKTTLINLLMRLQEPTSGEIRINDIPIQNFNIEDYRSMISVVTQNIHLFQGTIKENITFCDDIPDFQARDDVTFCTDIIEKLENAYNTEVGSNGMKLSGGERQKIALLRALHHKSASILVLDEATASYDLESESAFNRFIQNCNDFDFFFIVTHRKEVLNSVDKIIHLTGGMIEIEDVKERPGL